jgi:hypothetical protein
LCNLAARAQQDQLRTIELDEVVIRDEPNKKLENRVRPQNVHFILNPNKREAKDIAFDSCYFATRFRQPEQDSISLYSLELKLSSWDTALFDLRLLIYQDQGTHKLRRTLILDPATIGRRGKTIVPLFGQDITLHPGDFYIGFGFSRKKIARPLKYRVYVRSKGDGAILHFDKDGAKIQVDPLGFVFPFRIAYRRY